MRWITTTWDSNTMTFEEPVRVNARIAESFKKTHSLHPEDVVIRIGKVYSYISHISAHTKNLEWVRRSINGGWMCSYLVDDKKNKPKELI